MAPSPPQIAKYHIVRRLGHGGMGTVYLARDPHLDRNVAIKVLREPMADEELLQRFLREARATANLRHENLVTIYEVGDHDHQPFIAMEYVDGTTLGELIKQRRALPLAQKLSFIEQICAGLHHAHRVGIVHRDIKPANVMVDAQGVIRILDFGIARIANSGMTSDGAMIGTLNYMSPEQMLGRPVDFRSDIFSLGAVAYELLSYHQAFPGALDDGLLHRLPEIAPTPLASVCPGLPPGLEAIVLRALAKAPLERFEDLDQMRAAVRHLRHGLDPHLEVETVVIPSRDKPKPSTRPASSAERRGLLERRARQIAFHREAARTALERGDLATAAAACDEALTLDPDDADATQLLDRVRNAATAAGVSLPDTLNAASGHVRPEAPEATRLVLRGETPKNRVPVFAAAAVVVLAIGGGVLWVINNDRTAPATETDAVASRRDTSSPAPAGPSLPPAVVNPSPAPAPQPPTPVAAAPVTTPAPAVVDSLAAPMARITQLQEAGDVAGALADLARIGATNDARVSTLARSVAQSAFRSMDASLAAAIGQKAPDLATASYTAAEVERRVAEAASSRNDHVESGRRALAASAAYRKAESDARAAALAAARTPDATPIKPAAPPASAAATPAPANPSPAPEPPPTTAPRPSALDTERSAIVRALTEYQEAYRQRDVKAVKKIYPNLLRDAEQDLAKQFRACRFYDLTFGNMEVALAGDPPTTATVTVQSEYLCQPNTAQKAVPQKVEDIFRLRKIAGGWVIDRIAMTDPRRGR